MFTQLFGNFLLRKGVVTPDQLLRVIKAASNSHVKLGTLCMHAGLMTPAEVEKVYLKQTQIDKRFGEIAVEEGFLTASQVEELMENQGPHYLILAQELVEQGLLSHEDVERLLYDYQTETELFDLDMMEDHKDKLKKLVLNFCNLGDIRNTDAAISYLQLLFNNVIRFIGDDFTPMDLVPFQQYVTKVATSQSLSGEFKLTSAIEMDEQTAVAFASRYAGEDWDSFSEYVVAALQDFLNLHNGLFVVNMSNTNSIELTLEAPDEICNDLYEPDGFTYLLPLAYTFGTVNFLITIFN
ncbi:MAG: chemotaxis protein CheX [Lachnospiraceae bacterium]|jgi:hypothetical protein|nr:chemotaxis protein CheX [Lachnospiraceae bacterium]